MAQFKKGDRVRCVKPDYGKDRIYKIGELVTVDECSQLVFRSDGSFFYTDHWELATPFPIPDTVTIGGVEYIRKPEPVVEHEWKFGDVVSHKEHGVGIVTSWASSQYLIEITTRASNQIWVNPFELTFLRRADLSV